MSASEARDGAHAWRPVRLHARDEDAFEAQMLLNLVHDALRGGSGASHSVVGTGAMREPALSLRLELHGNRTRNVLLVPLYRGWPFDQETAGRIAREGRAEDADVLDAVVRIADLCVDPMPEWDDAQARETVRERTAALLAVCSALVASTDPRLDPYRTADGHVDVDRSDDQDGRVTTLVLDPDMAGDDMRAEDVVSSETMAAALASDPFDVSLTGAGSCDRTWLVQRIDSDDGLTASSSECDPMDVMRTIRAAA